MLGLKAHKGEGVAKNVIKAIQWYLQACAVGSEAADCFEFCAAGFELAGAHRMQDGPL